MTDRPAQPTPARPIGAEEVRNLLWQLLRDSEPSPYVTAVFAAGPAALSLEIRRHWQEEARPFRVTVEEEAPDGAHAATDAPVP